MRRRKGAREQLAALRGKTKRKKKRGGPRVLSFLSCRGKKKKEGKLRRWRGKKKESGGCYQLECLGFNWEKGERDGLPLIALNKKKKKKQGGKEEKRRGETGQPPTPSS